VLPEDDRDRQLANGFLLDPGVRNIQVLGVAGGWLKALERFKSDHIRGMDDYPGRFMVLLIDFDGHPERRDEARAAIPARLNERVFVLGVLTEPEELTFSLGSYETIGRALAEDCRLGAGTAWEHPLLRHNEAELDRLRERVRPILF
jgi:hypothetical protein